MAPNRPKLLVDISDSDEIDDTDFEDDCGPSAYVGNGARFRKPIDVASDSEVSVHMCV